MASVASVARTAPVPREIVVLLAQLRDGGGGLPAALGTRISDLVGNPKMAFAMVDPLFRSGEALAEGDEQPRRAGQAQLARQKQADD